MKKDFKPGDKVTVIVHGGLVCRGHVIHCESDIYVNYKHINQVYGTAHCTGSFDPSQVYHGHNVKVEITGEELPERLRVEERKERTIEFLDVLKGKIRVAKDVNLNFKSSPDPDSVSFEVSGMIYM